MPNFTLKIIEAIKGKQTFEELFINGVGSLDKFRSELEGTTYKSEFNTILSYMNFVAELKTLPDKKFKVLKAGTNNSVKEYEFKTKHLRVYCIQKTGGKIVVLGGEKKNQKKDLALFREIKKQFLNSL